MSSLVKVSVVGQRKDLLPSDHNYGFPSGYFYTALQQLGFEVSQDNHPDCLIAINHSEPGFLKFILRGNKEKPKILIRTEPKSVFPSQYRSRVENKYDLVLSPGNVLEDLRFKQFYEFHEDEGGPKFSDLTVEAVVANNESKRFFSSENWINRPNRVSMIASNKYSPVKNSGYDLRRELARRAAINGLDIYGKYWKSSSTKNLSRMFRMGLFNLRNFNLPKINPMDLRPIKNDKIKGDVSNKFELIGMTKYLLVIENSYDVMTEKVFDALVMGAIPIYVGPNLEELGIPRNIVIQCSPTIEEIEDTIMNLSDQDSLQMLKFIKEFVSSEYFLINWCEIHPYLTLVKEIRDFYEGKVAQ